MVKIFKKTEKERKRSVSKGFSLIEVLVALFVFSLLVATLAKVFVGFLAAQQNAKETQRNLEGAQLALNSMAKTLRTSKVITATPASIMVYDYSKPVAEGACMEYIVESQKLNFRAGALDEASCGAGALSGTKTSLIDGQVFGGFVVTPFVQSISAGKVTVSLQLCPKGGTNCNAITGKPIRIQTTVSLRVNR